MHCSPLRSHASPAAAATALRLLYICAGEVQTQMGNDKQFRVSLAQLNADCLRAIAPDLVIFPLIHHDQDAVAVLEALRDLGYRGACLVLTPSLPHPQAVEVELRAIGTDMLISVRVCG